MSSISSPGKLPMSPELFIARQDFEHESFLDFLTQPLMGITGDSNIHSSLLLLEFLKVGDKRRELIMKESHNWG